MPKKKEKPKKAEEKVEEVEEVITDTTEKEELLALHQKLKDLGITRISDLEGRISRAS